MTRSNAQPIAPVTKVDDIHQADTNVSPEAVTKIIIPTPDTVSVRQHNRTNEISSQT